MSLEKKQIAEFRGSIYRNDFGFGVEVYQDNELNFKVNSNGLLKDSYMTFEAFLDDLILNNPLWFTYYYVRIDKKYKNLVEKKLEQTINDVIIWIRTSLMCTTSNWCFEEQYLPNKFVENLIKQLITKNYEFDFLKPIALEPIQEEPDEAWELGQSWNGYCPESWLKGKKVRMRLNRNDFFESEETGLQITIFPGVKATILNFRGKGEFRSTPSYGDEIESGELFCPQNIPYAPFNSPTEIFDNDEEIKKYIAGIK